MALLAAALVLLGLPGLLLAVKDMRVHLPVARVGQSVRLSCQYDLDGAQLYSIKWYRDDDEFYSFVPKEVPPMRIYPHQNISVDLAQSDASSVTLLNVTRALVGFYKCEVSGDQPLFHTDIKLEYLNVYEPPSRKPELTVEKLPSGALRANCSTAPSFPGANITWYVDNNKHGPPAPAVHFHAREQDEWSSSELRLDAASRPRALRCEASLYTWKQSSDEVPLRGPGDHPQLAPVRGAASRASACGSLAGWGLTSAALVAAALALPPCPR